MFDTWAFGSGDQATTPHVTKLKINWFDFDLIWFEGSATQMLISSHCME